MKITQWIVSVLIAAFWVVPDPFLRAQSYTILHTFGDGTVPNDGGFPEASLVVGPNGNLYGTTSTGGSQGGGTIFEMTPTGVVTVLHQFLDGTVQNDGYRSQAALILGTDDNFYGTTEQGGSYGDGVVFRMTPTGTVTILHNFGDGSVANDGQDPNAALVQGGDGNFYGTTEDGGAQGEGTVFMMTPAGAVTILHSFDDSTVPNDGINPEAPLVQGADGNFYGTANNNIFRITPSGTEAVIDIFSRQTETLGFDPVAGMIQGADGNFYGTTYGDPGAVGGTLFKITPGGVATVLHAFGDGSTFSDGIYPSGAVVQGADGTLYGTTTSNVSTLVENVGSVFSYDTLGHYRNLHYFNDGSVPHDGTNPVAGLTMGPHGLLYGVTENGGTDDSANGGGGIIFVIDPAKIMLTSAATASGAVSLPFRYAITASNWPTQFAATNLPAGLSLDPLSGVISGTPTTPGTSTVTLTVSNSTAASSLTLAITIAALPVPVVTSSSTAFATVGVPFTYDTTATNNPTTFIASGLASTGLSINSTTGVISGTPTGPATLAVALTAVNATGQSAPGALSITVGSTVPAAGTEFVPGHRFRDGSVPNDGYGKSLIQGLDGSLYYLTDESGPSQVNGIFKMTEQGTISLVYLFNNDAVLNVVNSLLQGSDGNFYCTTAVGQFFRFDFVTHQITILANFGRGSGLNPPIQGFDGNFYTTTEYGGTAGDGTIVKITPKGVVTTLYNFNDGFGFVDGYYPTNPLMQASDGTLYGMTQYGGTPGYGTIFKITPQGAYTYLDGIANGSDITYPLGALIQGTDGNFYGTSESGGNVYDGTVFKMTPAGVVTILHSFNDGTIANDGIAPQAGVIQGFDGNFYGTTQEGGTANLGTLFKMTPAGVVTILHSFGTGTITNEGDQPYEQLIESPTGNIYGIAGYAGVPSGGGMIFSYQAMQTPVSKPIYTGSAYGEGPVDHFFSFTPSATFGDTGSGGPAGASVTPATSGGIMSSLVSFFTQMIQPAVASASWTMSGTLPPGLTFDSTSGTISGVPSQAGTTTLTLTPSNAAGTGASQTVTLYFTETPTITSSSTASTLINNAYNSAIQSQGGATAFGEVALPSWLTLNSVTGSLSGTPPTSGNYSISLFAGDDAGETVQTLTLNVTGGDPNSPAITSAATANANVGSLFTYQITTQNAANSFTALGEPAGFIFNSTTGTLEGIPTIPGTYTIPLTATNAYGSCAFVLTLVVSQPTPPVIAATLASTALSGISYHYQIPATGSVTTYAATGLPAGLGVDATTGIISGTTSAIGSHAVAITVTNSVGSSNSTLTLTVAAPTSFASWASTNHVSGGPTATPNHDGIPNLFRYLFDLSPGDLSANDRAALPSLKIATIGSVEYLTLTYRQYELEIGMTVVVQSSPDLVTWTTDTTSADQPQPTGATDPITGDPIMQAQVPVTSAKQFVRLNVTSP